MNRALSIRAGATALRHLQQNGLHPDDLSLIPGAAGGAKWLVLKELDRYLFEQWLPQRKAPLDLVGSSIGSWRLAAGILGRTQELFDLYLNQTYSDTPDRKEISRVAARMVSELLRNEAAGSCVQGSRFRLSIMTVRCRGLLASEKKHALFPGLALSAMLNLLWPPLQQAMFRRHLVHHPEASANWGHRKFWRLEKTLLSEENLAEALLASGSIPVVIDAVQQIKSAPRGPFRDGGLGDYHMPLNFTHAGKTVLFPHFSGTFKSGWFDKALRWRHISGDVFDNVVQVFPSAEFIARLPYAKIPDRTDFVNLAPPERLKYWRTVERESVRLVDEWSHWLEAGCPTDRVESIGNR